MAELNEQLIREELEKISDPDLNVTLKELDAIEKIEINGRQLNIYLKLVQPIHSIAEKINLKCVEVLRDLAPDYENEIFVMEAGLPESREILPNVKNIIAVASGKGGVGKSSVAANLAAALSLTGAKVGILDGDVYGPSQPLMFGLKDEQLLAVQTEDGKTVAHPLEKFGIKVASMGFIMQQTQAAIVRGPMLAGYFSMLFEQVEWGELDYLIFDLPPGTGDIQLTLTQKIPLTGAVIVTTPQELSVADVVRSISMFRQVNVDIIGVVENMSYFIPPDMPDKKYFIFGEGGGKKISEQENVNLIGQIPITIAMREGNDGGMPFVLSSESGVHGEVIKEIAGKIVSDVRKLNYENENSDVEISL